MKKLIYLLLVLAVVVAAWLCLNKQIEQKSPLPEPANAVVESSPPETNEVSVNSVPSSRSTIRSHFGF